MFCQQNPKLSYFSFNTNIVEDFKQEKDFVWGYDFSLQGGGQPKDKGWVEVEGKEKGDCQWTCP